ncbi:MAG TPA: Gfo/Idh/MocA family oxidoreductase [Blastocatellia bacterium]
MSTLSRDGKLRVAIVGFVHGHGVGILRELLSNADVEVVGVADAHPDIRDAAAKIAPAVPVYDDYRKLLDEKKPEVAWSFVPNNDHLEVTRECATRGISVVFEKPMAASYDQARQMLELARQHHIKLMINYQMAWWPENYTAHDLAKRGDLGKVWRVRAIIGHGGPANEDPSDHVSQRFWEWLNDERQGGGALLDFTCYGAVWLRWYLGLPKTVYAVTTHTRPDQYKTNTNATVLASFQDNGIGIIEGSWDLPRSFQDVEVFGDKGSVSMARLRLEEIIGYDKKQVQSTALPPEMHDPVAYLVNRFRTNQPIDGIVSPEFNVDVMEIVDAARRSAESGRPVSLPPK